MTSPYAPPNTRLIKEPVIGNHTDVYGNPLPQLLDEPRKCSPAMGYKWLMQAFNIFKENILLWIGMCLAFLVISFISGFIPLVNIAISLSGVIFIAGMIKGASEQVENGQLAFEHLFVGFKTHLGPLLLLVLASIVGVIVLMIPAAIIIGIFFYLLIGSDTAAIQSLASGNFDPAFIGIILLAIVVITICFLPLIMGMWFAPTLIILKDVGVIDAIKMSFKGCMKNILPFTVCCLITIVAFPFIVLFTLGFGMLLIYPLIIILYYVTYRDIWTDQPLPT